MGDYAAIVAAVRAVREGRRALRNAVYDAVGKQTGGGSGGGGGGGGRVSRVYATTARLLEHWDGLAALVASVPALASAAGARGSDNARFMAPLLVWEHLRGGIRGGGALARMVAAADTQLRSALAGSAARTPLAALAAALVAPRGAPSRTAAAAVDKTSGAPTGAPRWVRVNTLAGSVADAKVVLVAAGLAAHEIVEDGVVANLLRLPPDAHTRLRLHDLPQVVDGSLILQDKASCFTAAALAGDLALPTADGAPPRSSTARALADSLAAGEPVDAIDACAAPGNKTTHLAALLAAAAPPPSPAPVATTGGGLAGTKRRRAEAPPHASPRPHVYAFDRDPERAALLAARCAAAAGTAAITAAAADFLATPTDGATPPYTHVRLVLVDPSCSGSGMRAQAAAASVAPAAAATAPDADTAAPACPPKEAGRVAALAAFQRRAVGHALSMRPVTRVAYSTCSLYRDEDEDVVAGALADYNTPVWDAYRAAASSSSAAAAASLSPPIIAALSPALPAWRRRGIATATLPADQAAACVRVNPLAAALHPAAAADDDERHMCGFFVALCEKRPATPAECAAALRAPPPAPALPPAPVAAGAAAAAAAAAPRQPAPRQPTAPPPARRPRTIGRFRAVAAE